MVRRWSYINLFNNQKRKNFLIKKFHRLNVFKKSVSLRRFNKKYTKFRRKAFNRLRHYSNWAIYHCVFKFWSYDFINNKHFFKFQYLNGFFINNFLFFNFNFIINKNPNIYYNWNFFFFNFSKKSFFINYKKNNDMYLKNSNITKGWFFDKQTLELDNLAAVSYSEWDNSLYPFYLINNTFFSIKEIFFNFNFIILAKYKEIYKILILNYF